MHNLLCFMFIFQFILWKGDKTLIMLNHLKAKYKGYGCIFISLLLITDLALQSHPGLEFYPFLCVNNEEFFVTLL